MAWSIDVNPKSNGKVSFSAVRQRESKKQRGELSFVGDMYFFDMRLPKQTCAFQLVDSQPPNRV